MQLDQLKSFLDDKVAYYNTSEFIQNDPISIPHRFTKKQDIEIIGFWVAMLSWGQRKTIINKSNELLSLMDDSPYDFCMNHVESDRKRFENYRHRTFQPVDAIYFLDFFQRYYNKNESLETAFFSEEHRNVESGLSRFHETFFDSENALKRTRKHVSTPARNSSCKRLNMFLRWMIRKDEGGVDFGIWEMIKPRDLLIPLDVHVFNVARKLGILKRNKTDWKSVIELTESLRELDPQDPIKYDYALFSIGAEKRQQLLPIK